MSVETVNADNTASHTRTISRELAHRCAVSEVFVTSLDSLGEDRFVAGAQLPRMHSYYGDHAGSLALRHDPLVVMEAARQAAIALTHEFYAVPTDRAFLVRTFNGAGADTAAWDVGFAPADLVLAVRVPRKHHDGSDMHGVDMVLDISCGGVPMMTVDGSFSWTTGRRWERMRSGFRDSLGLGPFVGASALTERAEPAAVGRENWRNVVVGPVRREGGTAIATLVPDIGHPFLFDHPLDHVPGSLLIEACRQTALAMVLEQAPRLLGVSSTFDRFVELDSPAECRAEIIGRTGDRTVVRCEIHQAGAVAARVDAEFTDDIVVTEPGGEAGR